MQEFERNFIVFDNKMLIKSLRSLFLCLNENITNIHKIPALKMQGSFCHFITPTVKSLSKLGFAH